jgi:hypothetical protein
MESMSDAEKVAMAMKMQADLQAGMNAGASRPHPLSPEMRTAIAGFQQFNLAEAQAGAAKIPSIAADNAKAAALRDQEKAAHDKIDADARASFGSQNFKDGVESPAAIAALQKIEAAAWQKHFVLVNARLAAERSAWDQAKAELLPALTKLDADLAAIHYASGESATNRQLMSSYQSAGVWRLLKLLELAESDLTDAAGWYHRYENAQKTFR